MPISDKLVKKVEQFRVDFWKMEIKGVRARKIDATLVNDSRWKKKIKLLFSGREECKAWSNLTKY